MLKVRNELLKLDAIEACTGFLLRILGLLCMVQPVEQDGREIQDMTNFADSRILDKTLDIMLQEQVVVHSNMSQATAPICNMTIQMSEQAI